MGNNKYKHVGNTNKCVTKLLLPDIPYDVIGFIVANFTDLKTRAKCMQLNKYFLKLINKVEPPRDIQNQYFFLAIVDKLARDDGSAFFNFRINSRDFYIILSEDENNKVFFHIFSKTYCKGVKLTRCYQKKTLAKVLRDLIMKPLKLVAFQDTPSSEFFRDIFDNVYSVNLVACNVPEEYETWKQVLKHSRA